MKQKIIIAGLATLLLTTATLPSFAADQSELYGEPATPSSATRTVYIGPNTTYVNVKGGDVVKFVSGDQSFVWNFDNANNINDVDLSKIAPSGTVDHSVKVYIGRDQTTFPGA